MAGNNGGAVIAQRTTVVSHSIFYQNQDSNGYAVFNKTWDKCLFDNNWWGSNTPNFDKIFNFEISDDFKWIKMSFINSSQLLQYRNANLVISFNELSDRNNNIFNLNSSELLPNFEVILSLDNTLYQILNGLAYLSIPIQDIDSITAKVNDQTLTLKVNINPLL